MTRRVLITGFEPFGGKHTNASWEAVRRLPGRDGAVAEARKLQQRPFSYANMEKLVKKSKQDRKSVV